MKYLSNTRDTSVLQVADKCPQCAKTSLGLGGCDGIKLIDCTYSTWYTAIAATYLPTSNFQHFHSSSFDLSSSLRSPVFHHNNMAPSTNCSRSYTSNASLDSTMRPARPQGATATASRASSTSTSASHAYLGDGKVLAIESWNASVPAKGAHSIAEDIDPVVQAYLETKMALFRSVASNGSQQIAATSRQQ